MQTITKTIVLLFITLSVGVFAQDNSQQIKTLEKLKTVVEQEEKEMLKEEVEAINTRLDNDELTLQEANALKKEMAEKRAKNIENRINIINNKIELLKRNDENVDLDDDDRIIISIGDGDDENSTIYIGRKKSKDIKYDRRTTSDLVFGIGFNNALIEGEKLDDSPYKLGGSGFVELGWAWKTRLLENSNAIRLKYGFSIMWNKLDIKDNKYLVNNNGQISLEDFSTNLNKAKFRTTQLVFPVHFEFGPSKKIEKETYYRYSTRNQFKFGVGAFGGFNIGTLQKLKYKVDGRGVKDKLKGGYNTTDLVYGLSGYVAINDIAVYVKYELSPIFKNQAIKQNNISLGLRFDMD